MTTKAAKIPAATLKRWENLADTHIDADERILTGAAKGELLEGMIEAGIKAALPGRQTDKQVREAFKKGRSAARSFAKARAKRPNPHGV